MEFFPSSIDIYTQWSIDEGGQFYWKTRFLSCVESLENGGEIAKGAIDTAKIDDLLYSLKIVEALKQA
jgi:hypothetical protein